MSLRIHRLPQRRDQGETPGQACRDLPEPGVPEPQRRDQGETPGQLGDDELTINTYPEPQRRDQGETPGQRTDSSVRASSTPNLNEGTREKPLVSGTTIWDYIAGIQPQRRDQGETPGQSTPTRRASLPCITSTKGPGRNPWSVQKRGQRRRV